MVDVRLIHGSALHIPLDDESVQCVVTSPPYWGLRQYAGEQIVPEWGCALGLEPTPELYVEHIVEVFREVRRVLRRDGTLWLNLGSSYASGDTRPIQSREPRRAPAYGIGDRERGDSSDLGFAYSGLCDGCLAAQSSRSAGTGRPIHESASPHSQTARGNALRDSEATSPDASPRASQASTLDESSPPPLAECPHCGVVMFRASEQAIREAAVSHPCPPPVLPPLVEGS